LYNTSYMKYTKFVIKNFKGIKNNIVLDLTNLPSSNIFTLVGLNESGKTSILEAINLIFNRIPDEKAHEMIHKSKKGNFNDDISITAYLSLDDEDEEKIKQFCKNELDFILNEKILSISIEAKYEFKDSKFKEFHTFWVIKLNGTKKRGRSIVNLYRKYKNDWDKVIKYIESRLPKILYYQNFLFDFPQKIYLKEEAAQTKEEKEYRMILQDILDSFNNSLTIENHLLERLNNQTSENKDALESLLGDISQKMTDTIFNSWNEVFLKDKKEIELKFSKEEEERGYYLQLKIKQGKDRFSIEERSLGFRWFFSFLLFTEFRKERKEDFGETLFLLDEPASNLHQKSQQKLLNIFERLATKCKIIYSTHSHYLINPKFLAGTYIVKNGAINYDEVENFDQNETDVSATLYKNFVSSYPNEKDHFKPILDAIDYVPSNFDLVEKIICLEGKFDYYTFRYFQSNIFKKYNFHFYPGASVSKYDDLFRLYTAWNKDLIAIFDSDKQGKIEKDRYIKEISQELQKQIFVLENIDSKWINFTTESLFTDSDKLKITQYLFPSETTYQKSKFNTSLQDLFIKNIKLNLDSETKRNFKKVFEFIKNKI